MVVQRLRICLAMQAMLIPWWGKLKILLDMSPHELPRKLLSDAKKMCRN